MTSLPLYSAACQAQAKALVEELKGIGKECFICQTECWQSTRTIETREGELKDSFKRNYEYVEQKRALNDELNQYSDKLSAANGRIASLLAESMNDKMQIVALQAQIATLDTQIATFVPVSEALAEARAEVKRLEAKEESDELRYAGIEFSSEQKDEVLKQNTQFIADLHGQLLAAQGLNQNLIRKNALNVERHAKEMETAKAVFEKVDNDLLAAQGLNQNLIRQNALNAERHAKEMETAKAVFEKLVNDRVAAAESRAELAETRFAMARSETGNFSASDALEFVEGLREELRVQRDRLGVFEGQLLLANGPGSKRPRPDDAV